MKLFLAALINRLRQIKLLQLGHDGCRILRFVDDFLASDEALHIFLHQPRVERHHAELRAGLDIGLNTESFIVRIWDGSIFEWSGIQNYNGDLNSKPFTN